jgi:2,3-bisphosphoglycerate-independent phosphoglycerate mutase
VRVHHKPPDSAGEDKGFDAKVEAIEALDPALPSLLAHAPDVVAVTGDHSTPACWGATAGTPSRWSWRPTRARLDGITAFGESQCRLGGLGLFESKHLMA